MIDKKERDWLRKLREGQDKSQEAIGEELGVSKQSVSGWERGEFSPSGNLMLRLAKILGPSVLEHFGEESVP